jgi:hypothetical protein
MKKFILHYTEGGEAKQTEPLTATEYQKEITLMILDDSKKFVEAEAVEVEE